MIQLRGVRRQYGPQVLFEGLDWRILPGARCALVGPNGAGKTTLLRMLVGSDPPDAGQVQTIRGLRIGYLPQEVEAVPGGSVIEVALGGVGEANRIEGRLRELETAMAAAGTAEAELASLASEYGELRQRFEQLDGDRSRSRAESVLSGLGIPVEAFDRPATELSGGWRMRVVLARLLLSTPQLLLLDEPTNHLDLEAIDWLEEFLRAHEGAIVIVSHDRYFLNRMVDRIVELADGKLTELVGNYDGYLTEKQARAELLEQQAQQQAKEIAKVERFIERFRYKNTKARQVQSRVKALEKVERIQTSRRGRSVHFGFRDAPRSGDIVLRAQGVNKSFGATVVYDDLELWLRRGDRLALVGPNGAGKSTLLKLISGRESIDAGELELGHNVGIHYYAQHQLDALDPGRTVLQQVEEVADPEDRPRLRSMLGGFLFKAEDIDKPVSVLSGGEKARLALARMLVRPANLLLLDEPTNHLDLASVEVLENALNRYDGSFVLVSHDRYFINRVATSIGLVGNGAIERIDGDYDEYLAWKKQSAESSGEGADGGSGEVTAEPSSAADRREAKRVAADERNRQYQQRKAAEAKIGPVETRIAELEARLRELEQRQADPAVYSDPEQSARCGKEKSKVEAELDQAYAEWERLSADESPA